MSPTPANASPSSRDLRASILLVDDRLANLLALRAILEDLGHHLVEARSGEEALERLQIDEFAVVLLDVQMPGLDGFETARLIRDQDLTSHTPIVFLTAEDIEASKMEQGYLLGAVDFLVKPIVPVILKAKVSGFVELFMEKQRARREADQLRLLIHGTTEYAIFMLDPQGRIITWNPGAERIKQYRAEEIIGQHFSRFYTQEAIDRDWPGHELKVAQATGRFEDEGWRVRKDGSQFWANVMITALRDDAGNLRGFSKITRDLTDRKLAEDAARRLIQEEAYRRAVEASAALIQEQRERLHVTLASIGDAVITTDAEGRIAYLNPVAEQLTGWSQNDASGRPLLEVFNILNEQTRLPVENPAIRALKEGVVVGLANHTILIGKDGKELPIDDSAAPMRDANGDTLGAVLVFRDVTQQRQAAERLRRSEQELSDFFDNATIGFHWVGPDGVILRANKAELELLGYDRDEYVGREIARFHADQESIADILGRLHAGERLHDYPAQMICKDGSLRDVLLDASVLRRDGQFIHTRCFTRDVTEQNRAESKIRFQAHLLDTVGQAAIVTDPTGAVIYWNRFAESLYGWTAGEALGRNILELVVAPESSGLAAEIMGRMQTGENWSGEFQVRRRDGTTFPAFITETPVFDDVGELKALIGVSVDITDRKRTEQGLRFLADASAALAAQVDYQSTLQQVAGLAVPQFADWCAVDIVDPDGSLRRLAVAHVDPAKVALADEFHRRYPPDVSSLHGPPQVVRTGESDMMTEITDAVLVQGAIDEDHLRLLRELGFRSYMCVPLKGRGKLVGVVTFVSSESERRYAAADLAFAEELARRAAIAVENAQLYSELREADRRKDEFLATLAHELRNPLAPIRNSLQVLKMSRVDAAIAQQTREIMERQVHHLVRLVDDLLDVSRVMRGKIELRKEPVELATVVARAVETAQSLIEAQGHDLAISLPHDSLPLQADSVRLAQVVGNLLTNAAKYTEPNGRIQLTAQRVGQDAVLRVRDTGIGIARDALPHIFELFMQVEHASTRSQGGLGIGLTLVKSLVELHGGTIEAQSEGLGKGSEFIVRLPLTAAVQSERGGLEGDQNRSARSSTGLRLLIVDDNKDAATSLATMLKLQGHNVRVAHSGLEALEVATDHRPDLIFLDVGMPMMDGYEVARRLRQNPDLKDVVLAALTGWGQQEDRRRTAEAGFDHHLVKPPEPDVLESLLAELKKS